MSVVFYRVPFTKVTDQFKVLWSDLYYCELTLYRGCSAQTSNVSMLK